MSVTLPSVRRFLYADRDAPQEIQIQGTNPAAVKQLLLPMEIVAEAMIKVV